MNLLAKYNFLLGIALITSGCSIDLVYSNDPLLSGRGISGGIAEAFYGSVPEKIASQVHDILPVKFNTILDSIRLN